MFIVFYRSFLTVSKKSISFTFLAACHCGSQLVAIMDFNINPDKVVLTCYITIGSREGCGKRQLRNKNRRMVGEILKNKKVEKYRAEIAKEKMVDGDPVPPTIREANVYRNVRHETVAAKYLDPDPINALDILSFSRYGNEIRLVCRKPFMVHYWTGTELQLLKKYGTEGDSFTSIDATGDVVDPLQKPFDMPSGAVFLYQITLTCSAGQITVGHMLSECQDTDAIQFFLMKHMQASGVIPKEVVTDMSRALLNSITRTYTSYRYVEEYADACDSDELPNVYIRLDVAHFIHMYAVLLAKKMKDVKTFFMAAIGQLIMCRDKKTAAKIIKHIFTLALSKKLGNTVDGRSSQAQKSKKYLESLITGKCIFKKKL